MPNPKSKKLIDILGERYDEGFFEDKNGDLKRKLDSTGIVILPNFVSSPALAVLQREAALLKKKAYRSVSTYNAYVLPEDKNLAANAARNRKFTTSKGCIADDQVPSDSILRKIYASPQFRRFISKLQGIESVFPYADRLSSININYYEPGDSLEWHFDNADFAITILIKKCAEGGVYEYCTDVRYAPDGSENYTKVEAILEGKAEPKKKSVEEGSLMIFRGNKSLHRVTKVEKGERILATLNYNLESGIPLSEKSRMTFFGRIK